MMAFSKDEVKMDIPRDLKYSKEHEWVRTNGHKVTIGITDHAQKELGDVVFVELPSVGQTVTKGTAIAVVESVKAVSDVFSPVGGRVSDINDLLTEKPELVNHSPYSEGWMVQIEITNEEDLDDLLDADEYRKYVEEEKG